MRLVQNGSIPGRLEASHVINENYQAVVDKVKELQNEFLKAHRPDLFDENDGEAGAAAAEAGPAPPPAAAAPQHPPEVGAAEASATEAGADTQMATEAGLWV